MVWNKTFCGFMLQDIFVCDEYKMIMLNAHMA